MATNKWLSDLRVLKANTDALREHLRDGNVAANDNDTLQTLIGKVPQLAPIESSDKWQPDPLWKFPDPNGSGELKTIDEIFDEDSMASSYTYRGVYQIIGEYDTVDLKEQMGNRTNADTFILSDGTVYENMTATTLVHTWDKSKDVIDSKGRAMRYVRVYSNTGFGYIPSFKNTVVWVIHKLSTSLMSSNWSPSSSNYYYWSAAAPIECIRFVGLTSSGMNAFTFNAKKIIYESTSTSIGSNGSAYYFGKLKELEFKNITTLVCTGTSSSNRCFANAIIEHFVAPESLTNFEMTNAIGNSFKFRKGDFSKCNKLTKLTLSGDGAFITTELILPNGGVLGTLSLSALYNIKSIDIPNSVKSLSLINCFNLEEIIIPESAVTSVSISQATGIKRIILPYDFNPNSVSLQLGSCLLLEHDSMVAMLENLADLTGQTAKTITFGATNLAKLTDEEKAIATNKNWTLS